MDRWKKEKREWIDENTKYKLIYILYWADDPPRAPNKTFEYFSIVSVKETSSYNISWSKTYPQKYWNIFDVNSWIAFGQTFSFDILRGCEIFEDFHPEWSESKYICNENCDNICTDIWNCIWEKVDIEIAPKFSVNRLNLYWHTIHEENVCVQ